MDKTLNTQLVHVAVAFLTVVLVSKQLNGQSSNEAKAIEMLFGCKYSQLLILIAAGYSATQNLYASLLGVLLFSETVRNQLKHVPASDLGNEPLKLLGLARLGPARD